MPRPTAVLLPGTGSDEVFVRSVFAGPLRALGIPLVAPAPPPGAAVTSGYLRLLDEIAERARSPIVVGGISLGAHLATEWALRNSGRCAGVLAALPAWNGSPGSAPAATAAKLSADLVSRSGVEAALRTAVAGVQPWLAGELDRAWRGHGQELAESLRAAAGHPAPTLRALGGLPVPFGLAACTDDPVHPVEVARSWAAALPRARLYETTLAAFGSDREILGRAAALGWLRASTETA
ncbi:alpha/beta hydrolase [Saccharomonospora sp. NPDC006951]